MNPGPYIGFSTAATMAVVLSILPAQPTREKIAITGYVSQKSTVPPYQPIPVSGRFNGRVNFYPSKDAAVALLTIQREVSIERGALNIMVEMTGDLLRQDEVWYAVQLDLNSNGLDDGDWFGERGLLTAAPYAASTPPATFFQTNGGQGRSNEFGSSAVNWPRERISVCPFVTPPGGVLFDRIAVHTSRYQANITVGIYDSQGTRVTQAPLEGVSTSTGQQLILEVPETYLLPNQLYYGAHSTSSGTGPNLGIVFYPPVPNAGYVYTGSSDGSLPVSFSPEAIFLAPESHYRPMNMALYLNSSIPQRTASRHAEINIEGGDAWGRKMPEVLPP